MSENVIHDARQGANMQGQGVYFPADSGEIVDRSFWGVVVLKDWIGDPASGRQIRGFAGRVNVVSAEQALGFRTSTSESNWIAVVEGETYPEPERATVPGCQVRTIIRTRTVASGDYLVLGDTYKFGVDPAPIVVEETPPVQPLREEEDRF